MSAPVTVQEFRASRFAVSPSDPNYDALLLAHIKQRIAIDPATGCWLWQGPIAQVKWNERGFRTGGYASIGYRGRNISVHRVVWMIHNGTQPKKMDVCHTCDVRHCCNPDHLWLGTRSENLKDMVAKRRGPCGQKAAKEQCRYGHPFDGKNSYYVGTHRHCRMCERIRGRVLAGWPRDLAESVPPLKMGYTWKHYLERGTEVVRG